MTNKLLFSALRIAETELVHHIEFRFFPHWTFIVIKNRIFDWSTNRPGIPPAQFGYHKNSKIHSELAAFRKCYPKGDWSAINVRLNRQMMPRISKPCPICYSWMIELGCKEIYFTTESGWERINA